MKTNIHEHMNGYLAGVLASVKQDRSIPHDPVPQETPEREGRPSLYCRQCGLPWTATVHRRVPCLRRHASFDPLCTLCDDANGIEHI